MPDSLKGVHQKLQLFVGEMFRFMDVFIKFSGNKLFHMPIYNFQQFGNFYRLDFLYCAIILIRLVMIQKQVVMQLDFEHFYEEIFCMLLNIELVA